MNLSIILFLIRILLIIILAFSAYNFYYCTATMEFLFSIFVPVMIYRNPDTDKTNILTDNKGKAGIYQWTHILSGKKYVGSSADLSKRFNNYFSNGYLARRKTSYICNALLHYLHSSFSLTIFEYIDCTNLSKAEGRKLILEREQYYLDCLEPEYNLLKEAGSSLGYRHSPETIERLSKRSLAEEHKTGEK